MNIATYLKIKKNRLHEKIGEFEEGNNLEFHRFTPLRSPTVVLTGLSENCAGRNSLDRYCLATGLKAKKLEMTRNTVDFDRMSNLNFQSRVSLPIKVPGRRELMEIEIAVFDEETRRDMPIKLDQGINFGGESLLSLRDGFILNGAVIFPVVKVPKCGAAFDFHPFPSSGVDEGETLIYSKNLNQLPSQRWVENALTEGLVRITFSKIEDGSERVIFGTTLTNRIPPESRPGGGGPRSPTQICMFDVELYEWRSCQYNSIREVRIKKGVYPFWDN